MTIKAPFALIKPLEGYRALAIIAVLLFHLDVPFVPGGYIGVDLFFVISGFIITKNIASKVKAGQFTFKTFYVKRMRRLFPALFITILGSLIAGYSLLTPFDYEELSKSALYSTFSIANIHFWLNAGYFDAASDTKPLLHMWSLSVEEQFYIFWPLVLVGLLYYKKSSDKFLKTSIFGIFLLSSIGAILISAYAPATGFFWFFFRIYQFMAGAILVFILSSRATESLDTGSKSMLLTCLNLIGFSGLIIACYMFDKNTNTALAGLMASTVGLLLISTMNTKLAEIVFGNKLAVWIGQHSYSLYLVHWPIIVFYKYRTGSELSYDEMIGLALVSLIAAFFLRICVEQPFRVKKASRHMQGRVFTGIMIAMFMIVVILSLTALSKQGFPNRFDASLSKLLNERYDVKRHQVENRVGDCFLDREQNISELKDFCYVPTKGKKSVLIIGSSLAADVYPGLAKHLPDWSVSQVTASGCPPYSGYTGTELCSSLKRFIYEEVLETYKYDLVLLGGIHANASKEALEPIIDYMESRSINYAILGPRPTFEERPTVLIKNYGKIEGLEGYMQSKIKQSKEIDYPFSEKNYASLNKVLCEGNNDCYWYSNDKLYYKDAVHFSVDGSYFLGQGLARWIKDNHGKP